MLAFFRRYQKIFFIFTTIIITISFVFFGTYKSMGNAPVRYDKVVFHAIDGEGITRGQLEEMTLFLQTDTLDKLYFGGVWGPNFMNDGVIRSDFLETGLAQILITKYADLLREDLQARLVKEKRYEAYSHPQLQFLSAEMTWGYYRPQLRIAYDKLRQADRAVDSEAIDNRVRLFLEEKFFPSEALRRVLKQQQTQYSWIQPDPNLERQDLSLFGYHTVEDWFGPGFLHIACQVIIDAAKVAEQRGYSVSKEEVIADLVRQTQISFKQNENSPYLGVRDSGEYFQEQLRRMGMTESKAISLWQRVMLFRRLYQDFGNAIFADSFLYREFNEYAKEGVEIDQYQLEPSLHLASYEALQQFEIYLGAVSGPEENSRASLALPDTFLSPEQVQENTPELVQKRYLCSIVHVEKDELQTRVGIREMWDWQTSDAGWEELVVEFPELKGKGDISDDRLEGLEKLDPVARKRIDSYTRAAIVDTHPEWVQEALDRGTPEIIALNMRTRGGTLPIQGNVDREALMQQLDADNDADEGEFEISTDENNTYRIRVLDRAEKFEVMTFAEARADSIIEEVTLRRLQEHYDKIRYSDVRTYQDLEGEWRPLVQVRNQVADDLLEGVLKSLREEYFSDREESPSQDVLASRRLSYHLKQLEKMLQGGGDESIVTKESPEEVLEGVLPPVVVLEEQWKLLKNTQTVRRDTEETLNVESVLAMEPGMWSPVQEPVNGALSFFRVMRQLPNDESVAEKMDQGQRLMSSEAKRRILAQMLDDIEEKAPLHLDYFKRSELESEPG